MRLDISRNTFGRLNHEKPIRMKNILSFIDQVLAAFVVTLAYLFTLEYFGI